MVTSQLARRIRCCWMNCWIPIRCQPTATDAYRDELRQYLLRVPEEDEESSWRRCASLNRRSCCILPPPIFAGTLPVMKVKRSLTFVAEAMIDAVVQQAWMQNGGAVWPADALVMTARRGFAVVGYGNWGLGKLGYSSDLPDRVFLHDCPTEVMTDGEREIDGRQFPSAPGPAQYAPLQHPHLFGDSLRSGCSLTSVWCGGRRWSPLPMRLPTTRRMRPGPEHQAPGACPRSGDPALQERLIPSDAISSARRVKGRRRCRPKWWEMQEKMRPISAISIGIALILKPMPGHYRH